jgi:hypothetical protein
MRTPPSGPEWVHASQLRTAVRASSHNPVPPSATSHRPTNGPVLPRPLTRPDPMGAQTVHSTALTRRLLTRKWSPHGAWRSSMHGDEGGPRTVVDEALVRTPNFASDGPQRPAANAAPHSGRLPLTRTEEFTWPPLEIPSGLRSAVRNRSICNSQREVSLADAVSVHNPCPRSTSHCDDPGGCSPELV